MVAGLRGRVCELDGAQRPAAAPGDEADKCRELDPVQEGLQDAPVGAVESQHEDRRRGCRQWRKAQGGRAVPSALAHHEAGHSQGKASGGRMGSGQGEKRQRRVMEEAPCAARRGSGKEPGNGRVGSRLHGSRIAPPGAMWYVLAVVPVRSLLVAALAFGAAVTFWALAGPRLDAQGVYADEVHQAAAAFVWTGSPPEHMCALTVAGVPVLNMPYSGALKSAVYGLYMRLSGRGFSLTGWRRLGIAFTTLGLLAFALIAGRAFGPGPLLAFLALMVTDCTVVLASRHDWGPVALALLLRLLALAVWVRSTDSEEPRPLSTALIGALAGLAVFEKLSSVAFALPMLGLLALDPRRRSRGHAAAALVGLGLGGAPLIVANVVSWVREGVLVSLAAPMGHPFSSPGGVLRRAAAYLAAGSGTQVEKFILADPPPVALALAEAVMVLVALALALAVGLRERGRRGLAAAGAAAGYAVVFLVLEALPRTTWVHHWIIGTPFQYLAVAGALAVVGRDHRKRALLLAVGAWVVLRLVLVGHLEGALLEGRASRRWDPQLARLAERAAGVPEDEVFLAADWGMALPIYCFSQGRPGIVREPLWSNEWRTRIADLERPGRFRRIHVLVMNPPSGLRPRRTEAILRWIESRPGWREVEPPPWLRPFDVVSSRTFAGGSDPRPPLQVQ